MNTFLAIASLLVGVYCLRQFDRLTKGLVSWPDFFKGLFFCVFATVACFLLSAAFITLATFW